MEDVKNTHSNNLLCLFYPEHLQKELNYIQKAFRVDNKYSNWVIKKVLQQAKQKQQQQHNKQKEKKLKQKLERRAPYQIHEKNNIKVITGRNQNESGLYWKKKVFVSMNKTKVHLDKTTLVRVVVEFQNA